VTVRKSWWDGDPAHSCTQQTSVRRLTLVGCWPGPMDDVVTFMGVEHLVVQEPVSSSPYHQDGLEIAARALMNKRVFPNVTFLEARASVPIVLRTVLRSAHKLLPTVVRLKLVLGPCGLPARMKAPPKLTIARPSTLDPPDAVWNELEIVDQSRVSLVAHLVAMLPGVTRELARLVIRSATPRGSHNYHRECVACAQLHAALTTVGVLRHADLFGTFCKPFQERLSKHHGSLCVTLNGRVLGA
jgi:hypothetical protein